MESGARKNGKLTTIANNVLIKNPTNCAPRPRQRKFLGIFGRNTASRPIAGSNAQT
jgi:hypothetical protein